MATVAAVEHAIKFTSHWPQRGLDEGDPHAGCPGADPQGAQWVLTHWALTCLKDNPQGVRPTSKAWPGLHNSRTGMFPLISSLNSPKCTTYCFRVYPLQCPVCLLPHTRHCRGKNDQLGKQIYPHWAGGNLMSTLPSGRETMSTLVTPRAYVLAGLSDCFCPSIILKYLSKWSLRSVWTSQTT